MITIPKTLKPIGRMKASEFFCGKRSNRRRANAEIKKANASANIELEVVSSQGVSDQYFRPNAKIGGIKATSNTPIMTYG